MFPPTDLDAKRSGGSEHASSHRRTGREWSKVPVTYLNTVDQRIPHSTFKYEGGLVISGFNHLSGVPSSVRCRLESDISLTDT